MKTILKFAVFAIVSCVMSAQCADKIIKKKDPTIAQHIVIGAAAGATEVCGLGQPLSYAMNQVIQKKAVSLDPRIFYRGCTANVAGMAPITAIQVAGEAQGCYWVQQAQGGAELSKAQHIGVAFAAGAASGIAATPSESIPVYMQKAENAGKKTVQAARELGIRGMMRGFGATMGRDGGFTIGYTVGSKICQEKAKKIIGDNKITTVTGGITAGVVTGIVTHPLAVVKTMVQAGADQQKYPKMVYRNSLDAAQHLYQTEGIAGFGKGIVPRTVRIMWAIPALGGAKELYSDWIVDQK